MPVLLLANHASKQHDTLNVKDLGGGGLCGNLSISTYFDVAQHRYFDAAQYKLLQNLFMCFRKASCGIVVPMCIQKQNHELKYNNQMP